MQIKELLRWGHEQLLLSSDSARLDAELILSYVIKKPTTFLLAHNEEEVSFWPLWRYRRMIAKRKEGIPVAYLINHKEFFFLDFDINHHVLIPRPDTEILVECVINYLNQSISDKQSAVRPILIDVGTGSGCIPISVLKNVDEIKSIATEISRGAMRVAKKNIQKHHLKSRINLIRSDLLEKVSVKQLKHHDVIVTANLPYIPTRNFKNHPSTKFEPNISLYGGKDGMDLYKRLIKQLIPIQPRAIFFELFEFQIATLALRLPGYRLKYTKNMTGDARVMMMEREPNPA